MCEIRQGCAENKSNAENIKCSEALIFSQGMILIPTLIFLMVMMAMIYALNHVMLSYRKTLNQHEKAIHLLYELEAHLQRLGTRDKADSICRVSPLSANQVLRWLQKGRGCHLKIAHDDVIYLVETLGHYPCIQISEHDELYSTVHERINLYTAKDHMVLQARLVKKVALERCDKQLITLNHLGITSWRYSRIENMLS